VNNIIGRTSNPYNRLLSCGGSSGGEGALLALHGSPLGVGTDIGGSIRIPASFSNLWSLKPSHGRLPYGNIKTTLDGKESIASVCGPMAHCASDLVYFMQAVLQQEPWKYDPKSIDMPWRETRYLEGKTGKKVFGVIATDGIFGFDGTIMPHPPILRGIQQVITALRKAGHIVVQWQPYKHKYAADLIEKIFSADGAAPAKRIIASSGEPPIPNFKNTYELNIPPIDLESLWKLHTPHSAVKHDDYKYYGYTEVINLLDWPATTIPVTFTDKEKDIKNMQYKCMNDLDKETYEAYDPDIYDGGPVGIQLVGKRLQEEYLLGLTEQIGEALVA
ncbi:unnamed protein product, partial [Rotaria sp. Silwood1]